MGAAISAISSVARMILGVVGRGQVPVWIGETMAKGAAWSVTRAGGGFKRDLADGPFTMSLGIDAHGLLDDPLVRRLLPRAPEVVMSLDGIARFNNPLKKRNATTLEGTGMLLNRHTETESRGSWNEWPEHEVWVKTTSQGESAGGVFSASVPGEDEPVQGTWLMMGKEEQDGGDQMRRVRRSLDVLEDVQSHEVVANVTGSLELADGHEFSLGLPGALMHSYLSEKLDRNTTISALTVAHNSMARRDQSARHAFDRELLREAVSSGSDLHMDVVDLVFSRYFDVSYYPNDKQHQSD